MNGDKYCIILKSGVRVYLKADRREQLDGAKTGRECWLVWRFFQDNYAVADFALSDIAAIIEPSVPAEEPKPDHTC